MANGTYRETVSVNNVHAMTPWKVHIVGDEDTTPTDTVSPLARLTGADNDSTHQIVRSFGFVFDEDANCVMNLNNCGATDCSFYGAVGRVNCAINLFGSCTFSRNLFGLGMWQNSSLWIENGTHSFTNNTTGIQIQMQSVTRNIAGATFSGNGIDLAVSADSHAN